MTAVQRFRLAVLGAPGEAAVFEGVPRDPGPLYIPPADELLPQAQKKIRYPDAWHAPAELAGATALRLRWADALAAQSRPGDAARCSVALCNVPVATATWAARRHAPGVEFSLETWTVTPEEPDLPECWAYMSLGPLREPQAVELPTLTGRYKTTVLFQADLPPRLLAPAGKAGSVVRDTVTTEPA